MSAVRKAHEVGAEVFGGRYHEKELKKLERDDGFEVLDGERVLEAAMKMPDGEIFRGKRHNDCITAAASTGRYEKPVTEGAVQGFWTSAERFVDREQGARVALENKQIRWLNYSSTLLFSEDLY